MAEGWGFPDASMKAHYSVDGRSLCRRWLWLGGELEPAEEESPDDCLQCTRKLAKRLARLESGNST